MLPGYEVRLYRALEVWVLFLKDKGSPQARLFILYIETHQNYPYKVQIFDPFGYN